MLARPTFRQWTRKRRRTSCKQDLASPVTELNQTPPGPALTGNRSVAELRRRLTQSAEAKSQMLQHSRPRFRRAPVGCLVDVDRQNRPVSVHHAISSVEFQLHCRRGAPTHGGCPRAVSTGGAKRDVLAVHGPEERMFSAASTKALVLDGEVGPDLRDHRGLS